MTEPWLTKSELARVLRVSERTVTRLDLPHLKVGGQNRYRRSEVEAVLS
ncbi:MAG TPA: helix-turn-helix domain-containing protein [Solirubrobacterales bacterium]|nr:helix-turn-helix domain-containing protein [Solirubrobacterales bacterium]